MFLGDVSGGCNSSKTEMTYFWVPISIEKEGLRIAEVHVLKWKFVKEEDYREGGQT